MAAILVGPRYTHHCGASGYESFSKHISCLKHIGPIKQRFFATRLGNLPRVGDIGWRIDQLCAVLVNLPVYSTGIFINEMVAGFHMARNRGQLYHALYGDTDICFLRHFSRASSCRLVATFHQPPYSLDYVNARQISHHLDAVIIVSESQRQYFEQLVPPDRIFYVPHGVDTKFFAPIEEPKEPATIITAGSHLRDFRTLAHAIDLVLKFNPSVRFKAVGVKRVRGGSDKQLSHPAVEFIDGISDEELRREYQKASLAVFSLQDATANNALLESMACGLPVVATDIGGTRDYLGDDPRSLVSRWDPQDLAGKIIALLSDPNASRQLGEVNRRKAETFNYEVVAREMLEVYQKVQAMPLRKLLPGK